MPGSTSNNHCGNSLLNKLPEAEFQTLSASLVPVNLHLHGILFAADEIIDRLYFLESGIISLVAAQEDGSRIEVGLIGYDGLVGSSVLLGSDRSIWEGLVQGAGRALSIKVGPFRTALKELPSFQPLLLRYLGSVQTQIAQSVVCNARHPIEQRLARWILTTHDRVEPDRFIMTQEFMSTMLGVRRPGVTLAVGALTRAGLIRHEHGVLHVVDRKNLEAAACECYRVVRREFDWLLKKPEGSVR